ncbi:uncharacterized protein [Gorilla gorilla gorilla]|uniref:uncharacterized protein n=1 Tax=Gorilla gorilla gorilla TaxID=9595 RepID=UPI00300B1278
MPPVPGWCWGRLARQLLQMWEANGTHHGGVGLPHPREAACSQDRRAGHLQEVIYRCPEQCFSELLICSRGIGLSLGPPALPSGREGWLRHLLGTVSHGIFPLLPAAGGGEETAKRFQFSGQRFLAGSGCLEHCLENERRLPAAHEPRGPVGLGAGVRGAARGFEIYEL